MGLSSWCPSPNQNHSPNPCVMRLHYICTELKLGTKLIRSLRLLQLGQGRSYYKGGGG